MPIQIINYELAHYVDEENVFLEPSMLDPEFAAPELLQGRVSTTAADIWLVRVVSIYIVLQSLWRSDQGVKIWEVFLNLRT